MTNKELIEELQKLPPDLPVVLWDAEEDEYVHIAAALYEDGTSEIALLP
jgi:hypothetical protein